MYFTISPLKDTYADCHHKTLKLYNSFTFKETHIFLTINSSVLYSKIKAVEGGMVLEPGPLTLQF